MSHCALKEGKVEISPLLPPTPGSQGLNWSSLQSRIFLVVPEPWSPFGLALRALSKPDGLALFAVETRQGGFAWWGWDMTSAPEPLQPEGGISGLQGLWFPGASEASATLRFRAAFCRLPPQASQLCPACGLWLCEPSCPSSLLGSQQRPRGHRDTLNLGQNVLVSGTSRLVPLPAVLGSLKTWPLFEYRSTPRACSHRNGTQGLVTEYCA